MGAPSEGGVPNRGLGGGSGGGEGATGPAAPTVPVARLPTPVPRRNLRWLPTIARRDDRGGTSYDTDAAGDDTGGAGGGLRGHDRDVGGERRRGEYDGPPRPTSSTPGPRGRSQVTRRGGTRTRRRRRRGEPPWQRHDGVAADAERQRTRERARGASRGHTDERSRDEHGDSFRGGPEAPARDSHGGGVAPRKQGVRPGTAAGRRLSGCLVVCLFCWLR